MASARWFVVIGAAAVVVTAVAVTAAVRRDQGFPTEPAELPPTVAANPVAEEAPPDDVVATLTLRGDGLGEYRFGDPLDVVLPNLVALIGDPNDDEVLGCQEGEQRAVRWAELSVGFVDDQFAAWVIGYYPPDRRPLGLRTEVGLGLGAPVDDLGGGGARVDIGPTDDPRAGAGPGVLNFTVTPEGEPPVNGVIEGGEDDGKVVALYAGATCTPSRQG